MRHNSTGGLTGAELCGSSIQQVATAGDVLFKDEDTDWWSGGLPEVSSADEFFESWLYERVVAARATPKTLLLRQQCMITIAWWFQGEQEGWILHMGPHESPGWEWPVFERLSVKTFKSFSDADYFDLVLTFPNKHGWLEVLHETESKFHMQYHSVDVLMGRNKKVFGNVSDGEAMKELPRCLGVLDFVLVPKELKGDQCDAIVKPKSTKQQMSESALRCDLERVDGSNLTAEELFTKYSHRPVVFTNMSNSWAAHRLWRTGASFANLYGAHTIPEWHLSNSGSRAQSSTVRAFVEHSSHEHAVIYNDNSTQGIGDSKLWCGEEGEEAAPLVDAYTIPAAFHSSSRFATLSIGGNPAGVGFQRHQVTLGGR